MSELATTSRHSTEVIPPPNLVGDLKTFDITANLDWVTAIARGWSADARLSYMQADEVGSDGIASKPVIFQFISPEQVATYQRGAATQDGEVVYRLHVEIGEGTVVVRFLDGRPELDESPPEGTWCALPLAFETALEQQSIPVRPNYRALGGFSVSGTTFWQISTQSNSHSVSLGPDCQLK